MEERERYRPFSKDSTKSVQLKKAPLALVLCQIRWPWLSRFEDGLDLLAHRFGEAIEDRYPVFTKLNELTYSITADGVHEEQGNAIYQWRSLEGGWHVSLSKRFLSFHRAEEYTSFADFKERLEPLVTHLLNVLQLPVLDRIGVRYVNRITEPELLRTLASLVKPEVLGFGALVPTRTTEYDLARSLNYAQYQVRDDHLHVRSGSLAPGESVDPAVPAIDGPSWVLDLDASQEMVTAPDAETILYSIQRLADIDYDYFKYITTEGFVNAFGEEA